MVLRVKPTPLGSRPTVFIPRWTTRPCILYQVCATRGVDRCRLTHKGAAMLAKLLLVRNPSSKARLFSVQLQLLIIVMPYPTTHQPQVQKF